MPAIRVFEPAMCCNTGLCGSDVDQELVTFNADLKALQEFGVDVSRANLAGDPTAFTTNPSVVAFLRTAGSDGLPLTLVDGVTVLTGRHPTRDEMLRWAGVPQPTDNSRSLMDTTTSSCCGGDCDCGSVDDSSPTCCGGEG